MPRYMILNPEVLKSALIATVDQHDEESAIQAVPLSTRLPSVVVVVDQEMVAGLPRFVVNDEVDGLLSKNAPVVNRTAIELP